MHSNTVKNNSIRILVADDEKEIHNFFGSTLTPSTNESLQSLKDEMAQLSQSFLNAEKQESLLHEEPDFTYELSMFYQGDQAVSEIEKSLQQQLPYSIVFLDVRMPPGIDGVKTAEQIRKLDPNIQIVMITAFSDVNPREIAQRVPPSNRLLYLQKPIHTQELKQLASSLSARWVAENNFKTLKKDLEKEISQRTKELKESNIALRALLSHASEAKKDVEDRIISNIKTLLLPHVDELLHKLSGKPESQFAQIVKDDIQKIASSFSQSISNQMVAFTPREMQVADYIRQGKTNKQIADLLNVSSRTVEYYRDNIREKCGIKNKKVNLQTFLSSLSS